MPIWIERSTSISPSRAARDERALIDAAFSSRPGVLMGVELDEGEGPVQAAWA